MMTKILAVTLDLKVSRCDEGWVDAQAIDCLNDLMSDLMRNH